MNNKAKKYTYKTLKGVVNRLFDVLNNKNLVLLFAHNRTGKTRLSMAFKEQGKKSKKLTHNNNTLTANGDALVTTTGNTFYFNAFTEDLFTWDNDIENDINRKIKINSKSKFFNGFKQLALEQKIATYLERYTDLEFNIDYEKWDITFSIDNKENIKISRGEQNIFIWCIFMALCELIIAKDESYKWIKYIYIDDPISSLDDNNAISVACDLLALLSQKDNPVKTIISTHHSLFFNALWNECKFKHKHISCQSFFYFRRKNNYLLQKTGDTSSLEHIVMLIELQQAIKNKALFTYHFNVMRNILEKTAVFLGYDGYYKCLRNIYNDNDDNQSAHNRALNIFSHGKYSIYQPIQMQEDNQKLFEDIFNKFMTYYRFKLPT